MATEPRQFCGSTLVLLRHGESLANASGVFSGWRDDPLTDQGEQEAAAAGQMLAEQQLLPDVVHTSVLNRTIRTAELVLAAMGRSWIPVHRSWRLNERHYGALQGRNKAQLKAEVGDDAFTRWRRTFTGTPPPLEDDHAEAARDPRYAHLPPDLLPTTESLADVVARLLPYWYDNLVPDLRAGHTSLVVGHGNSLRALIMHLDDLTREQVEDLNMPTGIPLVYDLDQHWKPTQRGGTFLDPTAAAERIARIRAQGGT